ncbi:MAG: SDR family NAD(P)-dependent oxidoreductase [Candidatus Nanopelagicales bacterium]
MSCQRPHALITGTSSGIGHATMNAAAATGWHVFAGDRADPDRPTTKSGTGLITPIHLDVTMTDDITDAANTVHEHVGERGLDGLANVAGIGIPGPMEIMPLEQLRRSFDVDFFGQVAVTQAMLPMLRTAKGRIVFIGSLIDRLSIPFMGALATSKSAVAALADTWRQELAPWGMHVGLVEPGFISTGADKATKERIDRLLAGLNPDQAALYSESFREMTQRGYATQTSGSSPDGVAEVILQMLTDRHPKDHVLTGSKAHIGALAGRLPTGVQDLMRRKAFGLPDPDSR